MNSHNTTFHIDYFYHDALSLFVPFAEYCPITFSPLDVVVEYGASFSVNCSSRSTTHQFGLSWNGFYGTREDSKEIFRIEDKVTDWEMNIKCYMHSNGTMCSQDLPITIYSEFFFPKTNDFFLNSLTTMNFNISEIYLQRLQTVCSSDLWITADQWQRESSMSSSVTFTMWLLFKISWSNGTKDRLCWIKPPSPTLAILQWMKLSHSWSVQTELMMELNTDVKQSWIWEQKDLRLLENHLSMLKFTVSLLFPRLAFNSVPIFRRPSSVKELSYLITCRDMQATAISPCSPRLVAHRS